MAEEMKTGDVFVLIEQPEFSMSFYSMTADLLRTTASILGKYDAIVWQMITAVLKHNHVDADEALKAGRIYQHIVPVIGSIQPGTCEFYLDAEDPVKSKFICRAFMNIYDGKCYSAFNFPSDVILPDELQDLISELTETKF